MQLTKITTADVETAMEIIDSAKEHLKEQGIDQWQQGYPNSELIHSDAMAQKGYFVVDSGQVLGYLFIDFDGEPAYSTLEGGEWASEKPFVVAHRIALSQKARGRGMSDKIFRLIEAMSIEQGIRYFRIDTDADNHKMQHILKKNGFTYRGVITFDESQKIAFDKEF